MRCLVFVIGLLAASTNAQQATAYPYGFGCGGPARPFESVLSYTGVPRLGSTFSVNYQAPTFPGASVTTFARLYMGFSARSWAGMVLPVWLGNLAVPGTSSAIHCMIWTSGWTSIWDSSPPTPVGK